MRVRTLTLANLTFLGCLTLWGLAPAVAQEGEPAAPPAAEAPEQAEQPEQPEAPPAEEPKAEPQPETPQPEQPKAEEPKPEEPKTETPAEEPKAETPAEPAQPEEGMKQESAPEEPKAEEPKAEEPKAEEPKAEEPKAEEPKAEEPKAEEPKTEQPPAEEPKAEEPPAELPAEVTLTKYVTLPMVGIYGRATVHIDPVDSAIAHGTFTMPKPGDDLTAGDGREVKWREATSADDGLLSTRSIRGGYACAEFESPVAGVMLLEATGHATVYVNGLPVAGDPYAYGDFKVPVEVVKGINTFVFHVAQGELRAKLVRPETKVALSSSRHTLPSLVKSEKATKVWAAVTVANQQGEPLASAKLEAQLDGQPASSTSIAWLDAASLRGCPVEIEVPAGLDKSVAELTLRVKQGDQVLAEQQYELAVVKADALQTHTYRSRVDGSVQSYVVVPATTTSATTQTVSNNDKGNSALAAIVALHTDGMTAQDYAGLFRAKTWAHLIVPSGRGMYPLDWEDWSRIDASEALADARTKWDIDDERIYASGHGMGGHGALVLATTEPDTFAGVATTAAWPSLWTYGGGMPDYRDPSPVQEMLLRAASPSDTLAHLKNLTGSGVYLAHGADDDQIDPGQSRLVAKELANWHNDFAFHELSGKGNWWGPETVDSAEAMQFLAARQRDSSKVTKVILTTADLGTVATSHWLTIAAQQEQFAESSIEIELKQQPLAFVGTTKNVKRITIDKSAVPPRKPFVVRLDDTKSVPFAGMPASGQVWLEKVGDQWMRRTSPKDSDKSPQRYGGMKQVFDHNVLLVYGTIGNDEENAWSRAKAHYDAETFAYRAGGALEVIPDTEFNADTTKDRNVVIYGNVDSNRAWAMLMSSSPVQVRRGRLTFGIRPEQGDDLGLIVVRPRSGSNTRLVAAVSGTGAKGMRLTNRLRYFWAGVAYPDWLLLGPQALENGDPSIRAAGYFGEDWDVEEADVAWRDLAL
ncbi:alpha/beta hydrolase family protein [Aeoliella mucimassa]|uniref:Esterase n=1 Tax=Aeoliella mucimassa TaxID=2527972 RepID=A0A518AV34_9BACT|nr:alpha/beta hydrolase-fold protein [Aeoliella mucimassa]QDU58581.1 Putative esterase [Aeoliella mucimassa]